MANWGHNSKGCDLPTLEIPDDEGKNFKTKGSQGILDGIRSLYDQYIKSSETTDKYGRKVQTPDEGYDFMSKTNSVAPTAAPAATTNDAEPAAPIIEKK